MPRYLVAVRYTSEGVEGLLREGGSSRRAAAEQVIASVGGTLECFYFAFGEVDMYAIASFPDERGPLAVSVAVAASGGAVMHTVPLVTPAEMDAVIEMPASYRPPGHNR